MQNKNCSKVKVCSSHGKKHIAVVGGGLSREREVSLSSSQSIIAALVELGYKVTFVDMGIDIATVLAQVSPDIVFNALHGTYGEDGCLPGLLNIMQIPYTHSGLLSSALAMNKIRTRDLAIVNDIPIPHGTILKKSGSISQDPIARPYVLKPVSQGSSIGIELVFTEDDFNIANYAFEYGDTVIIEEYIKGREIQVAVLDGKALGILEIKILKNRFYDYETKYTEGFAEHICPVIIPDDIASRIMHDSEKMYDILGCKSIARVEFLYNEVNNKYFLLELNTHPGFTPLSICPEIANYSGINFNQLIQIILDSASFE